MSLQAQAQYTVPAETARVANAIFPNGNLCITMAETLHPYFRDQDFETLYPHRGQPAVSPSRLALATVLQYVEGLTDRQTAEAKMG